MRGRWTKIQFLKAAYLNKDLPLSQRMRAAIELMPFMHPKLAVTAQVSEGSFAELLDARIARLKQMEAKLIEAPKVEVKPSIPRVPDRRYRRI